MIHLLIYLAVFVIIAIVVWYLLTQLGLPEPLNKIVLIAIVVIGAILIIGLLLSLDHGGGLSLSSLSPTPLISPA